MHVLLCFAGTNVEQVVAMDADSGVNALIKYRIQKGGFDDFHIDDETGVVSVASKLDFDRRSMYNVVIVAVDGGMGLILISVSMYFVFLVTYGNDLL